MIKSVEDLKVYQVAFRLAMDIYEITKTFPKEEQYSLTDQIRRSSRSSAINIREGYAKRKYAQVFIRHLNDSLGSAEETKGWLAFALKCEYILETKYDELESEYHELTSMLYSLMNRWETYEVKEDESLYSF